MRLRATSRNDHPTTSHMAAAHIEAKLNTMELAVLDLYKNCSWVDKAMCEVAEAEGIVKNRETARPRRIKLADEGYLVRIRDPHEPDEFLKVEYKGSKHTIWRITELGLARLARETETNEGDAR